MENYTGLASDSEPPGQTPTGNDTSTDLNNNIHPLLFCFLWLNVFITSGGNLLTIIAFLTDKSIYSKPANLLILNLAFADLKVGLVSLPLFNLWMYNGEWCYGETICKWWLIMDYTVTYESMFAILLISWDRMYMVRNIQCYIHNQTRKKVSIIALVSWMVTYSLCILTVLLTEPITGERNTNYDIWCKYPARYYFSYALFDTIVLFTLPVSFLCYYNIHLYLIIHEKAKCQRKNAGSRFITLNLAESAGLDSPRSKRKHNPDHLFNRSFRKDKKAAITLSLLVVTFVICWAPHKIAEILDSVSTVSTPIALTAEYILWVNSAINPFLYVSTNRQFRIQLKKMFTVRK